MQICDEYIKQWFSTTVEWNSLEGLKLEFATHGLRNTVLINVCFIIINVFKNFFIFANLEYGRVSIKYIVQFGLENQPCTVVLFDILYQKGLREKIQIFLGFFFFLTSLIIEKKTRWKWRLFHAYFEWVPYEINTWKKYFDREKKRKKGCEKNFFLLEVKSSYFLCHTKRISHHSLDFSTAKKRKKSAIYIILIKVRTSSTFSSNVLIV